MREAARQHRGCIEFGGGLGRDVFRFVSVQEVSRDSFLLPRLRYDGVGDARDVDRTLRERSGSFPGGASAVANTVCSVLRASAPATPSLSAVALAKVAAIAAVTSACDAPASSICAILV
jgi:hypothetical protein